MRALSDCEVVVLGRGHVQGVLAKDPAVRNEVQSVQERRRRELAAGGRGRERSAGSVIVFCGLERAVLDLGRGLEAWWSDLLSGLPWAPQPRK